MQKVENVLIACATQPCGKRLEVRVSCDIQRSQSAPVAHVGATLIECQGSDKKRVMEHTEVLTVTEEETQCGALVLAMRKWRPLLDGYRKLVAPGYKPAPALS